MGSIVASASPQALAFAASYTALLALMGFILTVRVILVRRGEKIALGDGANRLLLKRIRAHGNFCENAPFLIAILILLALLSSPEWLVHLVGLTGLTGRVLHAIGLSKTSGPSFGRVAGMVLTFGALIVGALALLVLAWR
jgi:uncharacterized membrane protein YecN with MAPEG domain